MVPLDEELLTDEELPPPPQPITPPVDMRYADGVIDRLRAFGATSVRNIDGHGRRMMSFPPTFGPTSRPLWSTTAGSTPKNGSVAVPGFVVVTPGRGVIMIPPVSVCHQVSTTAQRPSPTTSWYQRQISGLMGSPTEPSSRGAAGLAMSMMRPSAVTTVRAGSEATLRRWGTRIGALARMSDDPALVQHVLGERPAEHGLHVEDRQHPCEQLAHAVGQRRQVVIVGRGHTLQISLGGGRVLVLALEREGQTEDRRQRGTELVRHGGTAILSETPEIYGAEHLLTRRAASGGVLLPFGALALVAALTLIRREEMTEAPAAVPDSS